MATRAAFDDPKVKATRFACFKRDEFKCVICGKNRGIEHHHIKPVAKYPDLEFVVSNTITLCSDHHSQVNGKEHLFEDEFTHIVRTNEAKAAERFGYKRKNKNAKEGKKYKYIPRPHTRY